ncbi:DUF4192 domain-containing protein [Corynebacterium sp. zg-331]|uniref:DUF4192 domain-containing protein n=1 Tax=unclassified Corynebacterium TaxID=2624378 RepID=UPI00164318E7|nr:MULTISPECIES: DUF4192 domain-containing protein [unclassified Corynebacterium]MBC3185406.1 DUF4192 domain-containing protein [Corynebacterium sp. zg-331]
MTKGMHDHGGYGTGRIANGYHRHSGPGEKCPTDNIPGYLLANIPAVLGFYPQESVVLVGLDHDRASRYRMGPVVRGDYPVPPDVLDAAVRTILEAGAGSCMVFLVGAVPSEESVMALQRALHHPQLFLWGMWRCDEIATGQRYMRVGESNGSVRWPAGMIPMIAATPAMQVLVDRGELPALSRKEACASFQPSGDPWPVNKQEIQHLVEKIDRQPGLLAELMAEGQDILRGLGDKTHVVFFLSHTMLRDALVHPVVEHAEQSHRLLHQAARHTRGEARINALCLYAIAAVACGRPWRAALALYTALAEAPTHNLSRLLHAVLTQCGAQTMLNAVTQRPRPEG